MILDKKAKALRDKHKDTEELVLAIGEFYRDHVAEKYIHPKDIIESRFTSPEIAYKKYLKSAGTAVNIATEVLRSLGFNVRKVSGETRYSIDHAWIKVYLPESKKWKEFDLTRMDGRVTSEYKAKHIVHDWEDIKDQLQRDVETVINRMLNKEKVSVFRLEKTEKSWIDKLAFRAEKELCNFFELCWWVNKPRVLMVQDRETMDAMSNQKSEDWVVGRGLEGSLVLVIDYEKLEKESSHKNYTKKKYIKLIKHEMAHLFIRKLINKNSAYIPRWLDEGICLYVAKQYDDKKSPEKFELFLDSYDSIAPGLYGESGFVVKTLVEVYGRKKLLKLLSEMKKECPRNRKEFDALFKRVYGFTMSYKRINNLLTMKRDSFDKE